MTMPPLRPRHRRQALAGLQAAVGSVARPNPLVYAWRWRYELILTAAMTTAVIAAARIPAAAWMLGGCAALIAVGALWPRSRRLLIARAWCVITPHRVRAGCAGAWIHSREGKLPAVLLTRHRPRGERVYLWCHAGTCAQDFESALKLLITACWAQDIKVTTNDTRQQLVTLDVIRRPALKSATVTASTGQTRPANQTRLAVISTARQPTTAVQNGNGERRRGEVIFWIDDTYCLICDLDTSENFYFSPNMLVYPQAIEKVRKTGTKVAFTAHGAPDGNKKRRAAAVLVVGEYYSGVLVGLPPGRPHGWLRLQDPLGNSHLVYLRVNSNAKGYRVGNTLHFRVAANAKGAHAEDVTRAEKDEAA
jgi:hypothetical protein